MSGAISDLRISYDDDKLDRSMLSADPFEQFALWFAQARASSLIEPNAMVLATVSADGVPSARTVLLKGFDHGFCFFTNYESEKGVALQATGQAAICFYWDVLQRQVRIVGSAEKMSLAESTAYFRSRPRGNQLGAWASPQSQVIANRTVLEAQAAELHQRFADQELIPLPPFWGGFRVVPQTIEFWQGRLNRLHDRFRYRLSADHHWIIERLAP